MSHIQILAKVRFISIHAPSLMDSKNYHDFSSDDKTCNAHRRIICIDFNISKEKLWVYRVK